MTRPPGDVLRRLCADAQSLVLAAPYIKAQALTAVLDHTRALTSLLCVTRWTPYDLAVGASDAECRTIVKDHGGSFRLHPALHAKYYRIDQVVLIGSANLTSAAMGWSSQPNLEILCRAGDDFDACAFQQQLLRDAREIQDAEFRYWEAVADTYTAQNSTAPGHPPQLEGWRPATRDPRHLELVYSGRAEHIASCDEQHAARRDIQALCIPPHLTEQEFRAWISASLVAAPFPHSVIQLPDGAEVPSAYRVLASAYDLSLTTARRDMETVQSWLAFFAPETLRPPV